MTDRLALGAHLSTSQGLPAMVHTAVDLGATCVQLFTSSPQQWRAKSYTARDAESLRAACAETGVGPLVAHESYLINLASADPELLAKSRAAFHEEIARCGLLGIPMVVIHWGSYKGGTLEEGMARLAESLNACIPAAEAAGVRIVLETTAGQGAYLGGDFTQFPQLFAQVPAHDHLGVCLDTCHVFVAGYDLRDQAHYDRLWQDFDAQVGRHRLCVMHLNDTEKALGSHGDRHAHIGEGQLGLAAFRLLMRDPRLAAIPKILETPGGNEMHARNLQILRALAQEAP